MKDATRFLLRALFKKWNPYQAVLPYNLNWQITLDAEEKLFLEQSPLVVCDVGARGAAPEELAPFFSGIEYHAFDADAEECARLNSAPHHYQGFHAFPYYIGTESQRTAFHLYKQPGESSSYEPDQRFQEVFRGDNFGIERTVEVTASSLDAVYGKESMALPDFLKLDTQGSELEILQGAGRVLRNASLVEVEVEFLAMYEGQPLFHDVLKFMLEHDFELLYLNRVFGQRKKVFEGSSRGQMIFGDALFGRREDRLRGFSTSRLVKYILLLINYGHIDLAYHVMLLNPEIDSSFPMLRRRMERHRHGSMAKRGILSQLDKALLWLLHMRKYNQLPYDSDRSWPIR